LQRCGKKQDLWKNTKVATNSLYQTKPLMPQLNFVDDDFTLSDANFANLPPMQKLADEGENVQQRIIDIISGTVAAGTKVKWGIDMKTDDGGFIRIGTEDSDFFKILDITEEKPDKKGFYHVIYIYLQDQSLDLISDEELRELNHIREALLTYPSLVKLRENPEHIMENTKTLGLIGVEQSALLMFINLVNDMTQEYTSINQEPNFGGLLLFSDGGSGETDYVVSACQTGYVKTVFPNTNKSLDNLLLKITRVQRIDQIDTDRLFQLMVMTDRGENDRGANDRGANDRGENDRGANDTGGNDRDDDATETQVEIVKQMISRVMEWASDHPDLKWNPTHVRRCFSNFINVPYIDYVGNLEAANEGNPFLKVFRNIKTALKTPETPEISETPETPEISETQGKAQPTRAAIANSSCTLSMSLTLMQLRNQGCEMFELHNTGEVGGCMCYSKAALVNQMISLIGKFNTNFHEMYNGDDASHAFRIFNNNHCNPKLNPQHTNYSDSNSMFFIDIATAVSLFTNRKKRIEDNEYHLLKRRGGDGGDHDDHDTTRKHQKILKSSLM
jgi:hypothetical protein